MDLVIAKPAGFVFMTVVERKRHYGVIALTANKTAKAVKSVILEALSPSCKLKRLASDNGQDSH